MSHMILGGGCFWCLEAGFLLINGVTDVTSGYAGGSPDDANYKSVSNGTTGHAEVVLVAFDTAVIEPNDILDIFWALHDPTTPNRQGNDIGPQYRSVIFYENKTQKALAEESIKHVQQLWNDPVVTEVAPLEKFYPAEDHHQRYFEKNPSAAYCQVIINPKLLKLKQKFAAKIKS